MACPEKQSNFECVCDFNRTFGVRTPVRSDETAIMSDTAEIDACMRLIREEMGELEKAVRDKDVVETVDALTDILYVVYGMGYRIGVNLDAAFALVHANNMSKLCLTEAEAAASVEFHRKKGVAAPAYRQSGNRWVVFDSQTRKILKPHNYVPVDLSGVCSARR